jgi:hypothetical protein
MVVMFLIDKSRYTSLLLVGVLTELPDDVEDEEADEYDFCLTDVGVGLLLGESSKSGFCGQMHASTGG